MTLTKRLPLTLALLCLAALPLLAADIAGTWKTEFDSQIGVQKYSYELAVDGEKVTGKAHFERMGQTGEVELLEGQLKGDQLSFVELLDFQGNSIRITYTGTVKGDEIPMTRQVGEFATEQIVLQRVKP